MTLLVNVIEAASILSRTSATPSTNPGARAGDHCDPLAEFPKASSDRCRHRKAFSRIYWGRPYPRPPKERPVNHDKCARTRRTGSIRGAYTSPERSACVLEPHQPDCDKVR